jgi:VanZ family protein
MRSVVSFQPKSSRSPIWSLSTHAWTLIFVGWILLIVILSSFPWWVESAQWNRVRWIPLLDLFRSPRWLLRDAIANCFLYVPLGCAYAGMRAATGGRLVGEAALAGLGVSLTCELYQVFSPVRFPSMTDVLINTVGALLGASIAVKSLARPRAREGNRVANERQHA